MPLYEFVCARCAKSFEELVSESSGAPQCPQCDQVDQVERIPFGKVMFGKKENLRPPFIKGTKPRRR